jgi:hypothetical protein
VSGTTSALEVGSVAGRPSRDRTLLRAYEPVLRFTEGELFRPIAVGPYVALCSFRSDGPENSAAPLVPSGRLILERLGDLGERFRDRRLYLR